MASASYPSILGSSIQTAEITDDAVTTAKIADSAVTLAKTSGISEKGALACMPHTSTIGDYTTPSDASVSSPFLVQIAQTTVDSGLSMFNGATGGASGTGIRYAIVLGASSALIGIKVNKVQFKLAKTLSPTGTATALVRNSSDTIVYTFGTLDVSILTGSATFTSFENTTDGVYTLASGDKICLEYNGGDGSNYVSCSYNSTDVYDSTNTFFSNYGSSWNDQTTKDGTFKLDNSTGAKLIDGSTATKATSPVGNNPYMQFDMGSALNLCAIALYWDAGQTTETEVKIQVSTDATTWTDVRKITVSNIADAVWNYIRFNTKIARYTRVYGTGTAKKISCYECKVYKQTDAQFAIGHEQRTISTSATSIALDGT